MNGQEKKLLMKIHSDLSHQIAIVATKVDEGRKLEEERWNIHNDRASEWKEDNTASHDKIFKWLEKLPCAERKWMARALLGLYGLVGTGFVAILAHLILGDK